jgi:RecA-family ATPase
MALRPLITIYGTTGVGKSKLAIELALKLSNSSSHHGWQGARIINADSMQVYAGMDVITNKVPENEMQGVDHLLVGFKKPWERYSVGQWVLEAISAVSSISFVYDISFTWAQLYLDRRNTLEESDTHRRRWDILLDSAFDVSGSSGAVWNLAACFCGI